MIMVSCSSSDSEESTLHSNEIAMHDNSNLITEDFNDEQETFDSESKAASSAISNDMTDRMIIHQADLTVNVKDIDKTKQQIEGKVNKYGGYIVNSTMYVDGEHVSGHLTVRVPENHFQQFLNDTEEEVAEIIERNISGQDITEEYIDIQSRIKSKWTVEARLLEFMDDAQETEDLLKISNDLATIQEQIEILVGQKNYLDNQTAFSTIEIFMNETRVIIPELDNKNFDTWERTKKQLAISTNFILDVASGLTVFIIGNIPVLAIFLILGGVIYFIVKRRIERNKSNE